MGREATPQQPTAKNPYGWNKGLTCSNCQRAAAKKMGRCDSCYQYYHRTGVERPATAYLRPRRGTQIKWCKNCGRMDVVAHNRCNACDNYYRVHKKERPRHLYKVDHEHRCKNCGIPLAAQGKRRSSRNRFSRGFCETCHSYKRRTGKARPKHLWGDGPFGWCDCGYPAMALVEDIPVCVRHKE